MSREAVEFAMTCMMMEQHLNQIIHKEPSNRVWISVFMHKMIEICKAQEDSESAFDNVIEALEIARDEDDD